MKTSESLKEIAPSLCRAQAKIKTALKDTSNPFFKSKYADLTSIIDACKDALNGEGISFLQGARTSDNGVVVETLLLHVSGEWISEALEMPVSKSDAQGVGSAITYGRRYGLQAMVGVPAEDDDGNAATKAAPKKMGSSARDTAVDALASFPVDQQQFLHGEAVKIVNAAETMIEADLHTFVEAQHYDSEEKLALWSLLPAPVRSKIKRGKPVNSELATQP